MKIIIILIFRLEALTGIEGTCFIYAVICIIGCVLIYFIIPETKGRSLSEIEVYFSYPMKTFIQRKNVEATHQQMSGILEQDFATDSYSTFK